jgi:ADP-heptose:LPS heptosyltransferase
MRGFLLLLKICAQQPQFAWQIFRRRVLRRPVIVVQRHAGIGDVVCTFPSVEVLRKNEPNAVVVYETWRGNIPVVECCSAVDLVVEQETPLANHYRRFLRPERILRPFLPDELNPPKPREPIHLVDEFARSFGLPALGEVSAQLKVPAKERLQICRRLREAYLNHEPIAVIHTGPTWQVKEWPAANWLELVKQMKDSLGMVVIQIGQDYCATGETRLSPRVEGALDWIGQLTIKEMLALLENAKIFVGIDSGMLHLAGAVSTPCVGLFGPTDPKCFLPRESPAVGVTSNVDCLGCHHNVEGPMHWQSGCPNAIRCMSGLSVEDVFRACSRLLQGANVKNNIDKARVM